MKGCLTIGVSYERVTAKSKAFVQEKFVLKPAYIRGVSLEGLGPMCLLGLKFFCTDKWADMPDSEDCIFQRISSSPNSIWIPSYCHLSVLLRLVKTERTSFPLHPSPVRTDH